MVYLFLFTSFFSRSAYKRHTQSGNKKAYTVKKHSNNLKASTYVCDLWATE